MNQRSIKIISSKTLLSLCIMATVIGCGVKGDPLPPEQAPRLGRGHPTYTKASRRINPEFQAPKNDETDDDEEEE